jgi:hypothetical protein
MRILKRYFGGSDLADCHRKYSGAPFGSYCSWMLPTNWMICEYLLGTG